MLPLQQTDAGVVIHLKVIPKASKSAIVGWEGGALKIRVTAIPEKGKANAAAVKLLATHLHVPKSDIQILSGEGSRHKKVLLCNRRVCDIEPFLLYRS